MQEARLGQGHKDISLGLVGTVALSSLLALPEALVVPWLGAGHVELVEGCHGPTEQRLLQLHPQRVALALRWDRRESPRDSHLQHLGSSTSGTGPSP